MKDAYQKYRSPDVALSLDCTQVKLSHFQVPMSIQDFSSVEAWDLSITRSVLTSQKTTSPNLKTPTSPDMIDCLGVYTPLAS